MPLIFIALPLIAVVVLNLVYKWIKSRTALWTAVIVSFIQMVLSAFYIGACLKTGGIVTSILIKQFSIDFMSAAVLFTIGLMAFVTLIVARSAMRGNTFNFANVVLLAVIGMNGISIVTDLFSLYVYIEITSAASFILIGINKGRDEMEGAFKYYLISAIATVMMLTSTALIFMFSESTDFAGIGKCITGSNNIHPYTIMIALILFTSGLLIKSGIIPIHFSR